MKPLSTSSFVPAVRCLGLILALSAGASSQAEARIGNRTDAEAIYPFDFSVSDQGFQVTEDYQLIWEYDYPTDGTVGYGEGRVWGTGLADQQYVNDCFSKLQSPLLDLAAQPDASIALDHYYSTLAGDPDACAAGLAQEPPDDSACGDGGILRLIDAAGNVLSLTPYSGYTTTVAVGDQAAGAFGGDSGGFITSYFDLQGLTGADQRLELLFVSNGQGNGVGWYIHSLGVYNGDIIPPSPWIPTPLPDTSDVVGPYGLEATATDNRGVERVTLHYQVVGGASGDVDMGMDEAGESWEGSIPGLGAGADIAYTGAEIEYYVEAIDSSGNVATWPAQGVLSFRVRLPAPESLSFSPNPPPEMAQTVNLVWQPPIWNEAVPEYTIAGYEVWHTVLDAGDNPAGTLELVADLDGISSDLAATVEAEGYPYQDEYQVCARYEVPSDTGFTTFCGDLSSGAAATLVVPRISGISPEVAYQGYTITLEITGYNTTFVQEDLVVDLGEGFQVDRIDVQDVADCTVTLTVLADTPPGEYPVRVSWPGFSLTAEQKLKVRSSEERPQLLSMSPDRAEPRDEKVIKFTGANTDFTVESPTVEFGSGIYEGPVEVLSATEFQVPIEVGVWAPYGERPVTVVSGGLSFQLSFWVDALPAETGSCAIGGTNRPRKGAIPPVALMMTALYLLRRRRCGRELCLRGTYAVQRMESQRIGMPGAGGGGPRTRGARRHRRSNQSLSPSSGGDSRLHVREESTRPARRRLEQGVRSRTPRRLRARP